MAEKGAVHSIIDNIQVRARLIQARAEKAANEMVPAVKDGIFHEFGEYQQREVTRLFTEAVDKFYDSYDPDFYPRNRSLYGALVPEPDEYGIIDEQIDNDSLFKADNLTPFERGGGSQGLYDLVFMEGWHGGAAGTDRRGETRETPSYRVPYGEYSRWGHTAFRTMSPHDLAMQSINGASGKMDNQFEKIAKKHVDRFRDQFTERINGIVGEIFSDWR